MRGPVCPTVNSVRRSADVDDPSAHDAARSPRLTVRRLIGVLLAAPALYGLAAYTYLACWHGKPWLFSTLIHENGRLTLTGSLFYFDHFLACVPMIVLFALCAAGGFALTAPLSRNASPQRARYLMFILLLPVPVFLGVAFVSSVRVAGWQRTLDYSLQSIERDGVLSPGGSWNQLQLSNIPIALGTMAIAGIFGCSWVAARNQTSWRLAVRGLVLLAVAAAFAGGLSLLWWPGWTAFLNPRWLAHSVREHATYPLTAIPIALACILATHAYVTGQPARSTPTALRVPVVALILLCLALALLAAQLMILRQTNVLAIAQRPPFATDGLSVGYLLASHVFEHFLDFVLIGPLSAGLYALVLSLATRPLRNA
jgi:hypothetical protein